MNTLILLHLSDLHFFDSIFLLKHLIRSKAAFSKQLIGMLNIKLRRGKYFSEDIHHRLFDQIGNMKWDYLVISGDLTCLSTEAEFVKAREELEFLTKTGKVLLTAGNHDRYVRSAIEPNLMEKYFGDCFPFKKSLTDSSPYPVIELSDSVLLFELEQATPRSPISSRGRIKSDLPVIEKHIQEQFPNHLKIAVGHYPAFLPDSVNEGYFHGLSKKHILRKFLLENDILLYLHGHIHKSWAFLPHPDNPLICINSGGCCRYTEGDWSGFHRITIDEKKVSVQRVKLI